MSCLGVHFALSKAEVETLKNVENERDVVDHIKEVIEEEYFANQQELLAQSDKSWDAMHRALADGELTGDGGEYPLNHVVLGGGLLYTQSDYIVSLKTPAQVKDIAAALHSIAEVEFRRRYFAIKPRSYGMELSEEDFQYTWDNLQSVRDLFQRAAQEGRFVLFTADQ